MNKFLIANRQLLPPSRYGINYCHKDFLGVYHNFGEILPDRPNELPMNSSRCLPKDIRLQSSEDVPATRYDRWAIAPSPKPSSLTIDITPKINTPRQSHSGDRPTRAIGQTTEGDRPTPLYR